MTLNEMQDQVDTWIREHGGYWDRFQILARMTEELGEIAGALQRIEGLRPRKTKVDLASEVGDLLFTLAAFANANHLNLSDCLDSVLSKYTTRDGAAWNNNQRNHT
jgi:NTP pyrophosphatase (non-canonical NTP hydrolase)